MSAPERVAPSFDADVVIQTRSSSSRPGVLHSLAGFSVFRELVIEAVRIGKLRTTNHLHLALLDLIVSQVKSGSPVRRFVKLPEESRALGVAQAFIAKLDAWTGAKNPTPTPDANNS
jgi:hypothetical protein